MNSVQFISLTYFSVMLFLLMIRYGYKGWITIVFDSVRSSLSTNVSTNGGLITSSLSHSTFKLLRAAISNKSFLSCPLLLALILSSSSNTAIGSELSR